MLFGAIYEFLGVYCELCVPKCVLLGVKYVFMSESTHTLTHVVQSNRLIEAKHTLTRAEQRLMLYLVSKINREDKDFQEYKIHTKEFGGVLGLRGGSMYPEMKKTTQRLLKRLLVIREKERELQIGWISSADYHDGLVEISFDPRLKPYLLMLKREFTSYQFKIILKFRSSYSIRIYQLIKQYESVGHREMLVSELIDTLTDGKYKLYSALKRYVLTVAMKEINETSDIEIDFVEKKLGRKVHKILFSIKKREPETLPEKPFNRKCYKKELEDLKNAIIGSSS